MVYYNLKVIVRYDILKKRRDIMELLQLRYFCMAAESENFSSVAKKFSVPTSAVSQSVRRLEKELGTELFDRMANRIALNEKGKAFYEKTKDALTILERAKNDIDESDPRSIDICINTNRRIVMQAVEKFKREYGDIEVKAKVFCNPCDDEFDLIVTHDDERLKGCDRRILLTEEIALAVSSDNPLYSTDRIDFETLKKQPFITTSETGSLYTLTESICREHGFKPKIAVQSDDPFYIRKCVEYGLGVAVVPMFTWQGQFSDNVKLVRIDGYVRDTFIYTSKDKKLSKYALSFIEMLIKECKDG